MIFLKEYIVFGHLNVIAYAILWQNRQIKILIKRNGRHLNTSGALA